LFTSTGSTQTLTKQITVNRPANGFSCRDFHVTFSYGNSATSSRYLLNTPNQISYNLYSNLSATRIIYQYPQLTSSINALQAKFSINALSKTVNFYPRLPAPNLTLEGGVYSDTITAKLYDKKVGQGGALIASANFTVTFIMPKTLKISLVDSNAPFNQSDTSQLLSFGTLFTGQTKGFDLKVQTNTSYSISFSSQNNGTMKHLSLNEFISYNMSVNGPYHSLNNTANSPLTLINSNGIGVFRDENYPIVIQVGNTTNKIAGEYRDFITIEATSLE
jgi:spore coat protein U-like protein